MKLLVTSLLLMVLGLTCVLFASLTQIMLFLDGWAVWGFFIPHWTNVFFYIGFLLMTIAVTIVVVN